MDRKIVVLEYQNNFADDFSTYAYGKILEKKFKSSVFYENLTSKRAQFENKMKDFNLSCYYISKTRAEDIAEKSNYVDINDFSSKNINKDKILNINHFRIDDIEYISKEIKDSLDFNNLDFIKNYDILENITSSNSIGLYINKNDNISLKFIENAASRLNKYLKKPILYIFSKKDFMINLDIEYQILNIADWREEFYFLKKCKHHIIYCEDNSYSEGFWASVLNENKFSYTIFDKKIKTTKKLVNWIAI